MNGEGCLDHCVTRTAYSMSVVDSLKGALSVELLNKVTFCVLDLETTGASPSSAGITEIGAIKYLGGHEIGRFQTFINPNTPIPAAIVLLTGITDSMVRNAPKIGEVLEDLQVFIGDSVIVAHNARFDLGFINSALLMHDHAELRNEVVDTVSLARRIVRNEVPNCKLRTLASVLKLAHQPSHRAINDVLATGDLLHFLIERASGYGVSTLSELVALTKFAAHPEAKKLPLTDDLPRSPGVYMFLDASGEVLYVGKAANIRQRVRSYFGTNDSRKKIGSLLRLTHDIGFIETPDPVTAEVLESRIIGKLLPRYNYVGTRREKYCYIRLTTHEEWPRLVITKSTSQKGVYIGPIRSRSTARNCIDAIESVVPLRRCTVRMGKNYKPDPDATTCSAARLGLAFCPCSGSADATQYTQVVQLVHDTLTQKSTEVVERLENKMAAHAKNQRYEEASIVRDRIDTLSSVLQKHWKADALRAEGDFILADQDINYCISSGILLQTIKDGEVFEPTIKFSVGVSANGRPTELGSSLGLLIGAPVIQSDRSQLVSSDCSDELMCMVRLKESLNSAGLADAL